MRFRIVMKSRFLISTAAVVVSLLLFSCGKDDNRINIGVIAPSTDWLPLAYGLEQNIIDSEAINIRYFSSGWEVNEAISAGRLDMAIMPFTYAWKNVSEGKDVRIISFFERESDGIVTRENITELKQLDGKKIGVLRASTLDVFVHIVSEKYGFEPQIEYFRTPTEMVTALERGLVDALSFYVPQIFRIRDGFNPIYWYGEDYNYHPCCDIVATQQAIDGKRYMISELMKELLASIDSMDKNRSKAIYTMKKQFSLSEEEAEKTLKHTGFQISLDDKGKKFELMVAEKMHELGYLRRLPTAEEVFYYDVIQDIYK